MEKETAKERLTYANIQTDLKGLLYHDIANTFVQAFAVLLLYISLNLVLKYLSVSTTILNCIFIVIFIAQFISLVLIIRWIIKVNQNKYTIVTDEVVETEEGHPFISIWIPYKPHTLRFAAHGKYRIPPVLNYKWSKLYDMKARDVLNSSHIGDTFMLVSITGKSTAMVYNTRLFELVT